MRWNHFNTWYIYVIDYVRAIESLTDKSNASKDICFCLKVGILIQVDIGRTELILLIEPV